jgi:hypothetical protein
MAKQHPDHDKWCLAMIKAYYDDPGIGIPMREAIVGLGRAGASADDATRVFAFLVQHKLVEWRGDKLYATPALYKVAEDIDRQLAAIEAEKVSF